jgi:hypothetical protein
MPRQLTTQRCPASEASTSMDVVDTFAPAEAWMCVYRGTPMPVETKFLRLRQQVELGCHIKGWSVCWLGGWDRRRIFYVGMVSRVKS